MPQTIEVHCNSSYAEEECRRRLAACYALLLDLAQKRRSEASSDVPVPGPADSASATEAEPKECFATSPPQEL
jgi:hypothetical protein